MLLNAQLADLVFDLCFEQKFISRVFRYDRGESVLWTRLMRWLRIKWAAYLLPGFGLLLVELSKYGIVVAAFVCILSYARWWRRVLVRWRDSTVVRPSSTVVSTLLIGSLFTRLFVVCCSLFATSVESICITRLDDAHHVFHLLKLRFLGIVVKTDPIDWDCISGGYVVWVKFWRLDGCNGITHENGYQSLVFVGSI